MEIHVTISTVWQEPWVFDSEAATYVWGLGDNYSWELSLDCLLRFCRYWADSVICWGCFTVCFHSSEYSLKQPREMLRKRLWFWLGISEKELTSTLLILHLCLNIWSTNGRFQMSLPQKLSSISSFRLEKRQEWEHGEESSVLVCAFLPPAPFYPVVQLLFLCIWILSHALKNFTSVNAFIRQHLAV